MKATSRNSLTVVAFLVAGLVAPASILAQTGPSGSSTNTVSNPAAAIWDIGGGSGNLAFTVTNRFGNLRVRFSIPLAFEQSGSGRFSGSGTNMAFLTITEAGHTSFQSFAANYRVTGSISSGRGRGHLLFNTVVGGMTTFSFIDDTTRKVIGRHIVRVVYDRAADGTADLVERDYAIVFGRGGGTIWNRLPATIPIGSLFAGDGSWTLVLNNLTTDSRNRVSGDTAVVTLASGQEFQFNVRGIYHPRTDASLLVLSAFDAATRGSNLMVLMEGNAVKAIKGRISGQFVNVTLP